MGVVGVCVMHSGNALDRTTRRGVYVEREEVWWKKKV